MICTWLPPIGMIAFNISMGMAMDQLNMFQTCLYVFIIGAVSMFLFFNFAELFVVLSLGGVAILNKTCYDSISKRVEAYRMYDELDKGKRAIG